MVGNFHVLDQIEYIEQKITKDRKISLYQFPGLLRPPQLVTCYRITEGP